MTVVATGPAQNVDAGHVQIAPAGTPDPGRLWRLPIMVTAGRPYRCLVASEAWAIPGTFGDCFVISFLAMTFVLPSAI